MGLANTGRDFMAQATVGAAGGVPAFNAANANIGVGDSAVAFDTAQTDLQAGPNKLRKGMDAGYPIAVGNVLKFKSTFGVNDANFAWNEWAIFNAPAAGTMLNRVAEYNGTKLQGQTWILEVTTTVKIGV